MLESDFDVCAVSETFLTSCINDSQVQLPGYILFRWDRSRCSHGGVAIYVRETLSARRVAASATLEYPTPEYLFIEVWSSTLPKILIATVYRPPKIGHLHFLENDLASFCLDYSSVVVLGDFNANLLAPSFDASQLKDMFASLGLSIVPMNPTHHPISAPDSWLDLCAVSDISKVMEAGQSDLPFLSKHDLIFIRLNCGRHISTSPPASVQVRRWRELRPADLHEDFTSADLNFLQVSAPNAHDIDNAVECFTSLLTAIVDRRTPLKIFSPSRHDVLGVNSEVKSLMKQRDKLHRLARRTRTIVAWENFRGSRAAVKALIRKNAIRTINSRLSSGGSTRAVWKEMDKLGLTKRSVTEPRFRIPADIDLDILNDHFVAAALPMASIFSTFALPDWFLFECPPPLPPGTPSFRFRSVSSDDVVSALRNSTSCAAGVDQAPIKLYKAFGSTVYEPIIKIFNSSLASGAFPSVWKRAIIRPLCKVQGSHDISDFRPISLLPALSKVLERVVLNQLFDYLQCHSILDPRQTGFRPGYGTQSAVTWFADEVRRGIDAHHITVAVFLDFSKAFDSVVHDKLLFKLHALGFSESAIKWFHSYLFGRQQAVDVDTKRSQWRDVVLGVPQGSVLGPLLYSLYVNDLPSSLHHCEHVSFADDTVIWRQCKIENIEDCISKVNEDISSLCEWGKQNNIKMNYAKSTAMFFGSAAFLARLENNMPSPITIDGHALPYASAIKYLGVIFDGVLSWREQTTAICKRVFGSLYRLKMNDAILSGVLRRRLVVALALPHLDYCATALTNAAGYLNGRLQRAFNACVRFVTKVPRYQHISGIRRACHWLSIQNRRTFLLVTTLYAILAQHQGSLHSSLLVPSDRLPALRRNPNRTDSLKVMFARTESYRRSFIVSAVNAWNSLPMSITSVNSPAAFRKGLFEFLMEEECRRERVGLSS
uniref:Reverse transcriptase domain-containing protein n=1 Tax=Bracon brevicornis TaxID=1563983 RepID=A0A6V7HLT2_9HYME